MKKKKLLTYLSLPLMALLLAGCGQQSTSVNHKPGGLYGVLYNILGVPMQHLMEWMANHMGHSYGMAIIVLVIIVRLILMPVMYSQMKKSTEMQERMTKLQPALKKLQERQKNATTPEEQAAVGQQMMELYRNNNVNMFGGVGCLPLLIQLPIFSALYMAIQYFPEMAHSTFLGIPLGKPSLLLAVLSFLIYLVQAALAMVGVPKEQKRQMGATMLMSPIMTFIIAISSSAGLGLYFFIGGIFAVLQTLMVNASRPRIRKQIEEEMKKNPVQVPDVPETSSASASNNQSAQTSAAINELRAGGPAKSHSNKNQAAATTQAPKDATSSELRNRQRNAGKQQRHHRPNPKRQAAQSAAPSKAAKARQEHNRNRQRNAGKQHRQKH